MIEFDFKNLKKIFKLFIIFNKNVYQEFIELF